MSKTNIMKYGSCFILSKALVKSNSTGTVNSVRSITLRISSVIFNKSVIKLGLGINCD